MVLSARVPFRRYARNAKAGKPIYGVALTGPELKGRWGIHISIPTVLNISVQSGTEYHQCHSSPNPFQAEIYRNLGNCLEVSAMLGNTVPV